jgi:hypothetical protein
LIFLQQLSQVLMKLVCGQIACLGIGQRPFAKFTLSDTGGIILIAKNAGWHWMARTDSGSGVETIAHNDSLPIIPRQKESQAASRLAWVAPWVEPGYDGRRGRGYDFSRLAAQVWAANQIHLGQFRKIVAPTPQGTFILNQKSIQFCEFLSRLTYL